MKPRLLLWFIALIVIAGLVASPVLAQETAKKSDTAKAQKQATKKAAEPQAAGTEAKPAGKKAPAEAKGCPQPGMVWVNTASKVYHKEGDRWFGKTKAGKCMTEDDAKKEGYKEAGAGAAKPAAKKGAAKKATM